MGPTFMQFASKAYSSVHIISAQKLTGQDCHCGTLSLLSPQVSGQSVSWEKVECNSEGSSA